MVRGSEILARMPFHVEISAGPSHARVFNLDDERLRLEVLEPWTQGRPVMLGDKEWMPAKSELKILEGRKLESTDLNFGRGWDSAEHTARDVTVNVLQRFAPVATTSEVAVLAETPWGREQVGEAPGAARGERRRLGPGPRGGAERRRDGGSGVEAPVVILAVESAEPVGWWLFEAGLAIGALGARAVVVGLGDEQPPEPLRDLGVIPLDRGAPSRCRRSPSACGSPASS